MLAKARHNFLQFEGYKCYILLVGQNRALAVAINSKGDCYG